MGAVYLARDQKLNRLVALKVLLGSVGQSSSQVEQFHAEAHAAAPLTHRNIVRIYQAGIEDSVPYIAMEYVDGEPLDRFLRRKGTLHWQTALYIGGEIAAALDCAHEHGVIHRDVKPSNVMLDRAGRVRLTDFGIARMGTTGAGPQSRFVGTPQYMSPEQCTAAKVGPRSDLFSLGVCIYQMIANRMPFEGESSMALIKAICTETPPRLNRLNPEVPDDVARLVAYLMEKEPDARPLSAGFVYESAKKLRQETGDTSAVAESITEFLKTETEIRPFSRIYERKHGSTKKRSTVRRRTRSRGRWGRVAAVFAVAALSAAAFAAPLVMAVQARTVPSQAMPLLSETRFEITDAGERIVTLNMPSFETQSLEWSGPDEQLLVRVAGKAGGLSEREEGLLSIDVQSGSVVSRISPAAYRETAYRPAGIGIESGSGNVYMALRSFDGEQVHVLRQTPDSAIPDPEAVLTIPAQRWFAPDGTSGRVIASPAGDGDLLLVLWQAGAGWTLHEHHTGDLERDNPGVVRTSAREPIARDSVSYSPDGRHIVYERVADDGNGELWIMAANATSVDGDLIALRVISETVSIDSAGEHIAFVTTGQGRFGRVLRVVRLSTGETIARIGDATLSRQAWNGATGELTFVSTPEGSDRPHLYLLNVQRPDQPVLLHERIPGAGHRYAVSPSGRWIASAGGSEDRIYVVPWNRGTGSDERHGLR